MLTSKLDLRSFADAPFLWLLMRMLGRISVFEILISKDELSSSLSCSCQSFIFYEPVPLIRSEMLTYRSRSDFSFTSSTFSMLGFSLIITVTSAFFLNDFRPSFLSDSLMLVFQASNLIIWVFMQEFYRIWGTQWGFQIDELLSNMKYQVNRDQLIKPKNRNFDPEKYNRSSSNSQLSMSPGHWKRYLAQDDPDPSHNRAGRSSSSKIAGFGSPSRPQNEQSQHYIHNNNDNAQKRRDDMMRRVKEIQDKVMPILKADTRKTNDDEDISWQNRMEERILKLETNLDSLEKSMQIQLQKRILEVEAKWQRRFDELMKSSRSRELGESSQLDSQRIDSQRPNHSSEYDETD